MDILIIDRDETERTGMEWFIRSNQLPFEHILHARNIKQANMLLSKGKPHVVILELELLSPTNFAAFATNIRRYSKSLITTTAEPVFERASQAIELQSKSLLVKPLNLTLLKKALTNATKIEHSSQPMEYISRSHEIYHSLFLKTSLSDPVQPIFLLIEPEKQAHIQDLFAWLYNNSPPFKIELYPLHNRIVCLAYVRYPYTTENIKFEVSKIMQLWREAFDFNINIAIYKNEMDIIDLHQAYVVTKTVLNMRFYKGFNQVFVVDQVYTFSSFDPFLTSDEQRFWMESLEKGDIESIKDYLYQTFTRPFNNYPEPEIVRIQLTSVLAQVRRFINNCKLSKIEVVEEAYHHTFQIILNHPVLYTIVQEFILFCITVIKHAQVQKQKREFNYLERSLLYLEHHFNNVNLRLEDLANYLEISPNYLSHLLSMENKPFKKIVTEFRINSAKKLLLHTNETIYNISISVGFKDQNYFSRVFKQFNNTSPKEYRRSHQTQPRTKAQAPVQQRSDWNESTEIKESR
ncbi:helix-turn-helix domain-containing protein [Virgibacillus dokdonensis]|uniref:Helix-turn-helix domain-containing protein n=1 Tax=Virgibacillus dokdonensis TaxID=302167 RepID=A0ABU7VCK9_9BACI